jgi:hypothetical protein
MERLNVTCEPGKHEQPKERMQKPEDGGGTDPPAPPDPEPFGLKQVGEMDAGGSGRRPLSEGQK